MTTTVAQPSRPPAPSSPTTPLPGLPSLINALSAPPEFDIITAAVRRYVAQRQVYYLSTDIRPKNRSDVMALSFNISTLLQALTWERLDQTDTAGLSLDDLRTLLGELLDSPAAKALGMELHRALGWEQEINAQQANPELLKQLVWTALILEIEPPDSRKPNHIAGYDLTASNNWGQTYDHVRRNIVDYLQWQTRTVQGYRSTNTARLALCILEPLQPDFAVRDIPKDLKYSTLRWVNFTHGVALAEALQPGTSRLMTFEQLIDLPLEQSDDAGEEALQIIAVTRLVPTIQWAIAHGVIAHRNEADYSDDELKRAVSALDEYSNELSSAVLAVLSDPPNRINMAKEKFRAIMGDESYLDKLIMRPATIAARFEYSFRNPSPRLPSGQFYLIDLFTAGFVKNGTDMFEPHLQNKDQSLFDTYCGSIDRLKGVDISAQYDDAFKAWFDAARAGCSVWIESLLGQIPAADRICLNEGAVNVYALRSETGETVESETAQDRADKMGRFGFVIRCDHDGSRFTYEVFPFRAQMKRRADLKALNTQVSYAQRPPGSKNINQIGTPVDIDWAAYNENKAPADSVVSEIIAIEIGRLGTAQARAPQSRYTLFSPRLKLIANVVAQQHMFYDYHLTYTYYRGKTGSEVVSQTYPPVLRMLEILIPGLSCFNAVRTNESPVSTCLLDVGSIMALPLFKLVRGTLKIAVHAGRIRSIKALGGFAGPLKKIVPNTVNAYKDALNPFVMLLFLKSLAKGGAKLTNIIMNQMAKRMHKWAKLKNRPPYFRMPQRVNGRIGYPLSGRGAGSSATPSSGLGRRINNVDEFDEFVAENNMFRGNNSTKSDMRADVSNGTEVHVYVYEDGSRTLVTKDPFDGIYIDLSNNKTVSVVSHYDYRTLKTWAVGNEATKTNVTRVPINQVHSDRATLLPDRLTSTTEAIKSGTYLPALDVRKTGARYTIINGHHRLQAALDLGLDNVPVIIQP